MEHIKLIASGAAQQFCKILLCLFWAISNPQYLQSTSAVQNFNVTEAFTTLLTEIYNSQKSKSSSRSPSQRDYQGKQEEDGDIKNVKSMKPIGTPKGGLNCMCK